MTSGGHLAYQGHCRPTAPQVRRPGASRKACRHRMPRPDFGAEVDPAELAAQKASNDAVKDFAQRMIKDHSEANDRLAPLAKANGIPLFDQFDSEQQSMRDRLQQTGKTEFDLAYIRGQIATHQKTVQLLIYQIGSGENDDLKKFASDTLPTVLDHLHMAQSIAAEISRTAQASPSQSAPAADKKPARH